MREEIRNYIAQMEAGLAEGSSLRMIPTYLGVKEHPGDDREILVIDAGGTNLRIARVRLSGSEAEVLERRGTRMPGTQGEISCEELISALADHILTVRGDARECGFCFSYPAEILENGDGKVLHFDKDVRIRNSEGLELGESLNREIVRRGEEAMQFTVLNDTVATWFAGVLKGHACDSASVIAMIWGTGFNVCYLERADNIRKMDASFDMVINMEAGGYDGFPMTETDKALDASTAIPGDQLMEKKVSGAYLGMNLYYTLLSECENGSFSAGFAERLKNKGAISTAEMNLFYSDPDNSGAGTAENTLSSLCANEEEKPKILAAIEKIADRAAYMTALTLASIIEHLDIGKRQELPANVVIEGTTYQKFDLLRVRLAHHMEQIVRSELGRYYRLEDMSESNLAGSAFAALCRA